MNNRLNRKTKLLYGVAGIGDSALYSLMGNFALFFFTTVAGIDPAVAGAIVAIGAVWDVVSGSFVGYISDKTRSSMGRRKPFLLAATFYHTARPKTVKLSLYDFLTISVSRRISRGVWPVSRRKRAAKCWEDENPRLPWEC